MNRLPVYLTGSGIIQGRKQHETDRCLIDAAQYETVLGIKALRNVDRITKIALASAQLALEKRKTSGISCSPDEFGLILGSTYGVIDSIHSFDSTSVAKGALAVNPGLFPNTVLNSLTCQVGIQLAIPGPIYTVCNGLTSGLDAIGLGFYQIQTGKTTMMLCGGVDEITDLVLRMHSTFLPLGEAAGFVLLENAASAKAHGLETAVEIIGYHSGGLNAREPQGLAAAMIRVIGQMFEGASQSLAAIDEIYISAAYPPIWVTEFAHKIRNGFEEIKVEVEQSVDWMSGAGLLQMISSLNSDQKSWPVDTLRVFINIEHDKESVIIIKNGGNIK